MIWIEMSRDEQHGGGAWGFTKSLWAPSRTQGISRRSTYWERILNTREGDLVLHLRGAGQNAAFVGLSTVVGAGHLTNERPPHPGDWGYAASFYRAELAGFQPLEQPILTKDLFQQKADALIDYFQRNGAKRREEKLPLFYVLQAGGLQCQNGAYLSIADSELLGIILGSQSSDGLRAHPSPAVVPTGISLREVAERVGQQAFARSVKENFGVRCAFPGCHVHEWSFLVASHIARWADAPVLRGNVDNGLCFCLMHDRAFELGLFTIDEDQLVRVNQFRIDPKSQWSAEHLLPYDGNGIGPCQVKPSLNALREHWQRIGYPYSHHVGNDDGKKSR